MHYMSLSQGRGEVKIGGRPGTPKGVQGLHPGITLSRAQYVMPPLQLGIHGPPRRPHGLGNAVKGTLWCALSSAGYPQTSIEAARVRCRTQGSLMGNQEIPGKFSGHHW